jgi:endonuclease/exonuclease/phosphatase family metal-dependent hydrolase
MAKNENKKKRGFFRGLLRFIGTLLLIVVVIAAAGIGYLTYAEYKPADRETVAVDGSAAKTLYADVPLTVLSWNVGYGALGDNADCFLDGGKMVISADVPRVKSNLEGMVNAIAAEKPDIFFLQEVDVEATRSHHINELESIRTAFPAYATSFANNFKVAYIPYPIPPLGKVDAGIATFSTYPVTSSERIQLPCPFTWPMRVVNLKRCLLVSRIPVANSGKELVLVNLHLEAYDSGEGKIAQTKMLVEFINGERAKGNYVIAGGDFNQTFSNVDTSMYPTRGGDWMPGLIDTNEIGGGWQFLMDNKTPTCRTLKEPYVGADKSTFQYYMIDGFIVSDNIHVESLETVDLDFVCTDHNPVVLKFTLED